MTSVKPPSIPTSDNSKLALEWWCYVIGFSSLLPIVGSFPALASVILGFAKIRQGGWKLLVLALLGFGISGLSGYSLYSYFLGSNQIQVETLEAEPVFAYENVKNLENAQDKMPDNASALEDSNYYRAQAWNDFSAENFEALEAKMWGFLYAERTQGKETWLNSIYYELGDNGDIEKCQRWVQKNPKSHFAWTVLGLAYNELGWKYRGGDWASKVEEENWGPFKENLIKGTQCLNQAYRLMADDPYSSVYLMEIGSSLSLGRPYIEKQFQRALKAVPLCAQAYKVKAVCLMPKWGGTWDEFKEFCLTNGEKAEPGSRIRLLIVIYYEEKGERLEEGNYLKKPEYWSVIQQEYMIYLIANRNADATRSHYAALARTAEKWDVVRLQMLLLKDRPGKIWEWGGWSSEEDYNSVMKWAVGH
jgi:hypothetical protein